MVQAEAQEESEDSAEAMPNDEKTKPKAICDDLAFSLQEDDCGRDTAQEMKDSDTRTVALATGTITSYAHL